MIAWLRVFCFTAWLGVPAINPMYQRVPKIVRHFFPFTVGCLVVESLSLSEQVIYSTLSTVRSVDMRRFLVDAPFCMQPVFQLYAEK